MQSTRGAVFNGRQRSALENFIRDRLLLNAWSFPGDIQPPGTAHVEIIHADGVQTGLERNNACDKSQSVRPVIFDNKAVVNVQTTAVVRGSPERVNTVPGDLNQAAEFDGNIVFFVFKVTFFELKSTIFNIFFLNTENKTTQKCD